MARTAGMLFLWPDFKRSSASSAGRSRLRGTRVPMTLASWVIVGVLHGLANPVHTPHRRPVDVTRKLSGDGRSFFGSSRRRAPLLRARALIPVRRISVSFRLPPSGSAETRSDRPLFSSVRLFHLKARVLSRKLMTLGASEHSTYRCGRNPSRANDARSVGRLLELCRARSRAGLPRSHSDAPLGEQSRLKGAPIPC